MTKRMLVDASHPEETRVVVLDGNRLEDYDVEVSSRRQLKGNIYLAKVTRVEPSLQAAFVDYGGNRHGFLAFSEIHPDYYQIPVADREALLAEQAALHEEDPIDIENGGNAAEESGLDEDDEIERRKPRISSRHYKIQEVIKRRQVMLVQVVKEERGNKGAALTTYLSLAGRCCVLMPNTSRGGGISRKITNLVDRRRLKKIVTDLEVPQGMGVIVRTAGAGRSKAEIRRDYDYLLRLWASIRTITLESMAPQLVYEEGNLVKRSIRDLYGRDIEEIIVQGEQHYRSAKEFMKLLIPSHAKRVKLYEDTAVQLFQHYGVEPQLESMHDMSVQLRSGGYLVINPTEALVSIDVNSGRATRERHIEETALRTNLEASDEIARQLRLRDLAGLIVIDYIDMENPRNQGQVERRLKDAMKGDKARVQIGRISMFGLLELSRQRLRPSVIETSFEVCPHCSGRGLRRTSDSAALAILRKIEEEGALKRTSELSVNVPSAVAFYLLNQKRRMLSAIEDRCSLSVTIVADDALTTPNDFRLERVKTAAPSPEEASEDADEAVADADAPQDAGSEKDDTGKRARRRRPRRRRRNGEDKDATAVVPTEPGNDTSEPLAGRADLVGAADEDDADGTAQESAGELGEEEGAPKRRRRGKRGGRRRGRRPTTGDTGDVESPDAVDGGNEPAREPDVNVATDDGGADMIAGLSEPQPSGDPGQPPMFVPESSNGGAGESGVLAQEVIGTAPSSELGDASDGSPADQMHAPELEHEPTPAPVLPDLELHQGADNATGETQTTTEPLMRPVSEPADNGSDAELIRANLNEGPVNDDERPPEDAYSDAVVVEQADDAGEATPQEVSQARDLEVVHAADNDEASLPKQDEPKRGWWQRLLE